MDPSACHEDEAGVWSCSCSPASFCSACILRHLQTNTEHTVSHQGPQGRFLCGMCSGITDDAIVCRYPVCICRSCAERLWIAEEPLPPLHGMPRNIAARPRLQEIVREAMQEPEVPPNDSSLHSLLLAKRDTTRRQLAEALDNINSFEDVIAKSLLLEEQLAEARGKAREMESALAEKSAEMQRLQAGGVANQAQLGDSAVVFGRIELVVRENERLKTENRYLEERNQTLERQLMDQQSLTQQVESLSQEVSSLKAELRESIQSEMETGLDRSCEQLQTTLREQLHETACCTAAKVCDVIPLVSQLSADSEWSSVTEGVFDLVKLGIASELKAADIRSVGRVILLFAKLLGQCEDMTVFVEKVKASLQRSPERGVALLTNLETFYLKIKGHSATQALVKSLMAHLGTRRCDDIMNIASRLSRVLALGLLCEFISALLRYFARDGPLVPEWRQVLTDFPVEWSDQWLAEQSLCSVATSVLESDFAPEELVLLRLLRTYSPQDSKALLTFAARAGKMLKNPQLKTPLQVLVLELIQAVESAGKVPEGRSLSERIFAVTKLISEKTSIAEIDQVSLLLQELNPSSSAFTSISLLVDCFSSFTVEDKLKSFATAVLTWIFPNQRMRDNLALTSAILRRIREGQNIDELAGTAGLLLLELVKYPAAGFIESCFLDMNSARIPMEKTAKFCLEMAKKFLKSSVSKEVEVFLRLWKQMLAAADNSIGLIDKVTIQLEADQCETLLCCLKVYSGLVSRRTPDALALSMELLTALENSSERPSVTGLLRTLLATFQELTKSMDLPGKALTAWKRGRARMPNSLKPYQFCTHVLERIGSPGVAAMLDEFIEAVSQENVESSTIYCMAEIYVTDASEHSFFAWQLSVLRGLRGARTLNSLMTKLKSSSLTPRNRGLFLKTIFTRCDSNAADLQDFARSWTTLVDKVDVSPLLNNAAKLQQQGLVEDFLDTVRLASDKKTVHACTELAGMMVTVEEQGVQLTPLSPQMKNVLGNRPAELLALLPDVCRMLRNPGLGELAMRLVWELESRSGKELLSFVAKTATDLLQQVQVDVVKAFCELLLNARDESQMRIVKKVQSDFTQQKDKVVALLSRMQGLLTLQEIDALFSKSEQARELVSVQASHIKFFDFQSDQWGSEIWFSNIVQSASSSTQLWISQISFSDKGRRVPTEGSSFVVLEDRSVFCCGGKCHAG